MYPDYECWINDKWVPCPRAKVCNSDGFKIFRTDESSIMTLDNWISQLNLHCAPASYIAFFGVAELVG